MPTLYHWEPNGFSLEVLAALYEKGLAFQGRYVDFLAMEPWALPFRDQTEVAFNIEIEGPVLVHQGQAMTDAFFINQLIDDLQPAPALRPADPTGRWKVNAWGRTLGEDLAPAVNALGCHAFLAPKLAGNPDLRRKVESLPAQERRESWIAALDDAYDEARLAEARRKIGLGLARAEAALADGPYLMGEALTLADLTLFGQANALPKLAPELLAAAPRVGEWLERMRARPAIQAALAESRTGVPDEAFAPGPEPSRWG
jgi:GSH-dependent disulfide-bond oxidoreductase